MTGSKESSRIGRSWRASFSELTKVASLELAETADGVSEAVAVSALGEPRDLGCLLDERRARSELVGKFGQHAMMPFLVFEDELCEVADGRIR